MSIDIKQLEHYCSEPEVQLKNVQIAYEGIVDLNPLDPVYPPRLVVFDKSKELLFSIVCRPYSDSQDYKVAIAEMLYAHSTFNAHSSILVLDSQIKDNNTVVTDCLNLYFISDSSCHVVQLLYSIDNGKVVWSNDHRMEQVCTDKPSSISTEMVEMLFVYAHVDDSPFSPAQLLSYYSSSGFRFRSFKPMNVSYIDFTNVSQ